MSKTSAVSVALLLLILYTAKIQKVSEWTSDFQKVSCCICVKSLIFNVKNFCVP